MRLEHLLETSASASADAIALVDRAGRTCTYGALLADANAVASELRALGIDAGDRVGLCAAKRIGTVAAIFGILKAGAAYVPVDAEAPALRNAVIFLDCGVRVILVDPECREALATALGQAGYPEHPGPAVGGFDTLLAAPGRQDGSACLAYILYTSGSAGRPKGVAHTHASALAFVHWCSAEFAPTPSDRFSSHAPLHFDLSILDLFVPIKHGAAIRLIDTLEGRHPGHLARLIAAEGISFWYSTPTILRAMVEHLDLSAFDHSSLRIVCFAGEVFPLKYLLALVRAWPTPRFYNLYGPTETNVCTFYRLPARWADAPGTSLPIGLPCSGDRVQVVDPGGTRLMEGSVKEHGEGELLVSGDSVMQGYWRSPDANAQAFVDADDTRWYRTGDIVQWGEDGNLLFRGRRDRMIKRRGFRIELGEIEAALRCHDAISEAAVTGTTDGGGEIRIVAFFAVAAGRPPSFASLKQYCSARLPIHMSPDLFHAIEALPVTSTGKTDYRRLQALARDLFHG